MRFQFSTFFTGLRSKCNPYPTEEKVDASDLSGPALHDSQSDVRSDKTAQNYGANFRGVGDRAPA
jgi:hypothetical protein